MILLKERRQPCHARAASAAAPNRLRVESYLAGAPVRGEVALGHSRQSTALWTRQHVWRKPETRARVFSRLASPTLCPSHSGRVSYSPDAE